jgi:hypothetical protein
MAIAGAFRPENAEGPASQGQYYLRLPQFLLTPAQLILQASSHRPIPELRRCTMSGHAASLS